MDTTNLIWIALIAIAALVSWLLRRPVISRVSRDIGLDKSGRWNGRQVELSIEGGDRDLPSRACVRIAAVAPCRFRVRNQAATHEIDLTGPPRVHCAQAPARMVVWCDDSGFAERIFSEQRITDHMGFAVAGNGDEIALNAHMVRVEVSLDRFDGTYNALFAAWNTAIAFVESLTLAVPEGGKLPLFDGLGITLEGM